MRHRVKVSPVRVHSYNPELACHVVTIIGYRKVCSCGGRSKVRRSLGIARADRIDHLD